MEDKFLYLVVTLSAALGLALLTVGIIFLSKRFQASVPRRGGACPWSNQQTILFALFLADLLLAYVFVQWYDWENDVLHWIQVVLLGIVVVLIGWLECSDPRAEQYGKEAAAPSALSLSLMKKIQQQGAGTAGEAGTASESDTAGEAETTSAVHEKSSEEGKQNSESKKPTNKYLDWCKTCSSHIVGQHRKHCYHCGTCSTGFDHHCSYLNICINERNYNCWLSMLCTLVVLLMFQIANTIVVAVSLADDDSGTHRRISDDLSLPFGWILLCLLFLIQIGLTFFCSDLTVMHLRFCVRQIRENGSASEQKRFPQFISTYKMLGRKFDEEELKNGMETVMFIWELNAYPSTRTILMLMKVRFAQHLQRKNQKAEEAKWNSSFRAQFRGVNQDAHDDPNPDAGALTAPDTTANSENIEVSIAENPAHGKLTRTSTYAMVKEQQALRHSQTAESMPASVLVN